jgi:hypothetical protein
VIVTDDFDGSEGAKTYRFAWQDAAYEVDLSDTHRDELLRTSTRGDALGAAGARRRRRAPRARIARPCARGRALTGTRSPTAAASRPRFSTPIGHAEAAVPTACDDAQYQPRQLGSVMACGCVVPV